MALSEWPDHFRDDKSPRGEMVEVEFETEMLVAVVTDKAIGLKADEESREVDYWIPISQIDGDAPGEGEWIESLSIPRWLAEEKGLLRCWCSRYFLESDCSTKLSSSKAFASCADLMFYGVGTFAASSRWWVSSMA